LSPAELLSVSDHLAVCETCRQQIEKTLSGDTAFLALHSELLGEAAEVPSSPSTHTDPTSREVSEYVDEMLAAEDLELINAAGGKFGLAVDDLLEFRNRIASELGHSYAPLPVKAASESWWRRLVSYFRSRFR